MQDLFLQNAYERLSNYMWFLAKRTAQKTEKFYAFAPAEGLYDALWPDDFTFPIAGLPALLSQKDYQGIYDFLTESVLYLPCVPDRVQFDGLPIMQPGVAEIGKGHGKEIPAHLPSAWVRLLCYLQDYGVELHHKKEWAKLIQRSYAQVDFACGLVYIDPQNPRVAFAYNDSAAITGFEFMCSVVNMRGFERALVLFDDVLDEETKADWTEKIRRIQENLYRLHDKEEGGFFAGSHTCKQFHVWANGLIYGRSDEATKKEIGARLVKNYEKIVYRGCTRQMIEDSGWERMLVDMPVGVYMNGGFWPTGTGYILQAVYETDRALGQRLITDLIENLPQIEYSEWTNKQGQNSYAKFFHMAIGVPLTAVKAMLEGKSLIEMF